MKIKNFTPVEIKSAATFTPDFLKGIDKFAAVAGDQCAKGFVLYNGNEHLTVKGTRVINPIKQTGLEELLFS